MKATQDECDAQGELGECQQRGENPDLQPQPAEASPASSLLLADTCATAHPDFCLYPVWHRWDADALPGILVSTIELPGSR